ncbi:hypothetical protein EVAR_25110_1 [Eumeta japonica]|uniref:Uncharacterized protein n=1 Tax=Eumeta variegata TaxID=151549 RepID=A0A4C1XP09_EUMVA|nr:hypothetical protein EVAR_25110_1 [Eumeta japonica]
MHSVSNGLIQALQSLTRAPGCVASPWLFILFMDSCLYDLKEYECGLKMVELSVNCLLYTVYQVILAASGVLAAVKVGYGKRKMKVGSMQWRCDRCVVSVECLGKTDDIRERCGLKEEVVTRVERGMLRWFGHLERMNESRLTKQMCRVNVCDGKVENPITTVVKNTIFATARSCMSHVNATEADLEYLREEPPYPEKAACIIKCLLEKIGVVKDNKYSKTGFMTIVTPLVFRNKKKFEHMKNVSENCQKEHYLLFTSGKRLRTKRARFLPELLTRNNKIRRRSRYRATMTGLPSFMSYTLHRSFVDPLQAYSRSMDQRPILSAQGWKQQLIKITLDSFRKSDVGS